MLKFDVVTGDYLGDAVDGQLYDRPLALAFSPTGDLFVSTWSQSVLHYDHLTGRLVNLISFTYPSNFTDLSVGLDGNLYVADVDYGIRKFDSVTGAHLGLAASLGSKTVSFVIDPHSLPQLGVLANDRDVDDAALTIEIIAQPRFGQLTMSPNGNFVYAPNPGFQGEDFFTYRAKGGGTQSANATVRILVGDGPARLPGDANNDGKVDLTDLNLVRNNFGATGVNVPGDTNFDEIVDLVDLNAVRNYFGTTQAGAPSESNGSRPASVESRESDTTRDRRMELLALDAAFARIAEESLAAKRGVSRRRSAPPKRD